VSRQWVQCRFHDVFARHPVSACERVIGMAAGRPMRRLSRRRLRRISRIAANFVAFFGGEIRWWLTYFAPSYP
jgi:hypothetical protein